VAWAAAGGSQSSTGSLFTIIRRRLRFYWIQGSILNSSVRDVTMPRKIWVSWAKPSEAYLKLPWDQSSKCMLISVMLELYTLPRRSRS
jgi:hypothetical protein